MTTEGRHHDLADLLDRCLRNPILGLCEGVEISWVTSTKGRVHRLILGAYDRTKGRIEINDRLDRWYVPEYVLLDVIRHELLHRLVGWTSREDWHGPVFTRAERSFRGHKRAELWVSRHLDKLLMG